MFPLVLVAPHFFPIGLGELGEPYGLVKPLRISTEWCAGSRIAVVHYELGGKASCVGTVNLRADRFLQVRGVCVLHLCAPFA